MTDKTAWEMFNVVVWSYVIGKYLYGWWEFKDWRWPWRRP